MEADQDSIDTVMGFLYDRVSTISWMSVTKRIPTLYDNQIDILFKVVSKKPPVSWINGGSLIVDWFDPTIIRYVGTVGEQYFSIYDPNVLDKIISSLQGIQCRLSKWADDAVCGRNARKNNL